MSDMSSSAEQVLEPVSSLQAFFHESMDSAIAANQVEIDAQTAHYVVNLLTLFSRSESFYEPTPDGPQLKPLAGMYAEAVDAPSAAERDCTLQRIGDVSLFVAGFFSDGLQRSVVDVDYYIYMGGGAYHSLSVHMRDTVRGRALGGVFIELAQKFQDVVDVLNEMRESARVTTDTNVLRAYEVWSKTGSQRAARMLRKSGVYPLESVRQSREH